MSYPDQARHLAEQFPELAQLDQAANFEDVLRILRGTGFPLARMHPVAMDEFTLDVVLPFPRDSQRWLVIDLS